MLKWQKVLSLTPFLIILAKGKEMAMACLYG